jgi:hypothetical protein
VADVAAGARDRAEAVCDPGGSGADPFDAAASADTNAIWTVLGDEFRDQLENPDEAQERENRNRIVAGAKEVLQLRADDANTRVMVIGKQAWPMPIPIVMGTRVGISGRRRRRRDPLVESAPMNWPPSTTCMPMSTRRSNMPAPIATATTCSSMHRRSTVRRERRMASLSVPAGSTDEASPFGPFFAEKAAYFSDRESGDPFMGYYYRVVSRQGENAPGGRYDYVINGNMIGGFAMIAWPADYGNSGIMTFIVNQNGKVYQKDLGEKTEVGAAAIQDYDPDSSWAEAGE